MRKGNTITLNTLRPNVVRMNGQPWAPGGPAVGGGGIVPLPPTEPEEPEPEEPEVPPAKEYIQFEDPEAERVLMAKGVSSDGIGITLEDAEAVTSIGTWFRGNTVLTSFDEMRYFTGVKSLETSAFNGCANLKSIRFSDSITEISGYCFYQCSSLEYIEAKKATKVKNYAFTTCSGLKRADLSLVETDTAAFNNCGSLSDIDLSTATKFAKTSFYNCKALQYDELVLNVTELGTDALYNVPIKKLRLPNLPTLPSNNSGNYGDKKVLEEVEFSALITNIPGRSLYYYTALQSVIIRATTPPTLANEDAFTQTNNCPIYVPDASVEAYKTATNWNSYADRIRPLSEIEGVVIEDGYELQQDGTIKQNDKYFVVGPVPVNGGESITWGMPSNSGTVGYLVEYNAEGGRVDYWRGNSNSRTITTKSSTKTIKACFLVNYKEGSYILDNTNGKYLWKGANVK